jgi:hypothetical protein
VRLRKRFFVLISLLVPINALWIAQSEVVRYAGHPTTISLFYNTITWLCVLVGGNLLLARRAPRAGLNRVELLTTYAVLNITSALGGHDTAQVLLPILARPYHYADSVNDWANSLFPFLPRHLVVTDRPALKAFYEGHSSLYQGGNLRAWLLPIGMWGGFLSTLVATMLFINVLLRRRWTQSEKLAFPLVLLPLELTEPGAPILRNRTLWAGLALAVVLQLWNGVATLSPQVPLLPLKVQDYGMNFTQRPWSAIGWLPIGFYPFGIGLGMLLPLDLLFSSWFFFLFWKAQLVLSAATGWDREPGFPFVNAQSLGAYLGIALGALWAARRHFGEVFLVLIGDKKEVPDPDDPISQQAAAWGALLCLGVLAAFCHFAGMNGWVIAAFFALYLTLAIGITRMRAELGPPVHDLHDAGPDTILTNVLGPTRFERSDLTVLAMFWGFNRAYRTHPMPIALEAFKLAERARFSARPMFWALLLAAVVGPIAGFWALLHLSYAYGAAAAIGPPNVLTIFATEAWGRWNGWVNIPRPPHTVEGVALLAGMGFTIALNALRGRLMGFPFHPVGYAVASSWGMSILWVPMLIAWLLKGLLLRYGGLALYRKTVPFFHGVILGECLMGSLWALIGIGRGIPTYAFWP